MDRRCFFFRKIPRARIYLKPRFLAKSLLELLFLPTTRGRWVKEFEETFSSQYHSKYALSFPFARVALYYLLRALNIEKGSEVLMTPVTIPDMVNSIRIAGLRPVFVDFAKNTYNIDCEDLKRKVTKKSRVLLITYLCGLVPDLDKIIKLADKYNLILLEDCSQNFGSKYKDKTLGTFGRAGIFSTCSLKALPTYNGGVAISNEADLMKRAEELRDLDFSLPPKRFLFKFIVENLVVWFAAQPLVFSLIIFYTQKILNLINPEIIERAQGKSIGLFWGGPDRLRDRFPEEMFYFFTDLQAKAGLAGLRAIGELDKKRIKNANILLDSLSEAARSHLPSLIEGSHNVFWRFPIRVKNYRDFQRYLLDHFIDTSRTNLTCCSSHPIFQMYKAETKEACDTREHSVFIPVHPSLDEKQMRYIADTINSYFKGQ